MPDLGKYATEVLSAYGVSLVLLIGLVWLSVRQYRSAKSSLSQIETRRDT